MLRQNNVCLDVTGETSTPEGHVLSLRVIHQQNAAGWRELAASMVAEHLKTADPAAAYTLSEEDPAFFSVSYSEAAVDAAFVLHDILDMLKEPLTARLEPPKLNS